MILTELQKNAEGDLQKIFAKTLEVESFKQSLINDPAPRL